MEGLMEGLQEVFGMEPKEIKELNSATIRCYEFKNSADPLFNLRLIRDGHRMFTMVDGEYLTLQVNGNLVMSDTRMERITSGTFVEKANGRVFIAGLGLGLLLHNLRPKVKSGEITELVVIEISRDVIDLVSPYYKDLPITYIHGDVLEYNPKELGLFDTIYFDIWPTINEDNLAEIKILHNRWKFRKNRANQNVWMDSWMKEFLQAERRKNNRRNYW